MSAFTLAPADVQVPTGAFTGGGRDILRDDGRPLCAFTRGAFRPCLHPVWTPAGHVVTAEQPADHPHHRGIWIASDHIGLLMQGPQGTERYDYNFYVDNVFQGRAPGKIRQTALNLIAQNDRTAVVRQDLDWVGPPEWGADGGRLVLHERRWTAVTPTATATILDITSQVTPADVVPVALGPTRHAWFNARVADGIGLDPNSQAVDDCGHRGAAEIPQSGIAWVDLSGAAGGGAVAGIAVQPTDPSGSGWFMADWGIITVSHIRNSARILDPGVTAGFACRMIAHDGPKPSPSDLAMAFVTPENMAET